MEQHSTCQSDAESGYPGMARERPESNQADESCPSGLSSQEFRASFRGRKIGQRLTLRRAWPRTQMPLFESSRKGKAVDRRCCENFFETQRSKWITTSQTRRRGLVCLNPSVVLRRLGYLITICSVASAAAALVRSGLRETSWPHIAPSRSSIVKPSRTRGPTSESSMVFRSSIRFLVPMTV